MIRRGAGHLSGAADHRAAGPAGLETLLDALAPQDILIVLDNCEHLIGACAKAADAIVRRCPQMHLLATSREPLASAARPSTGCRRCRCPDPATTARGGRVLRRGRAVRRPGQGAGRRPAADEQTAPLIVSICRRLDGLPLAIELAAARLRSLSLSDLTTVSTSGSACSPAEAAPPWRGSRPCGPPSSGPTRCSTAPSRRCCGGCRSSPRPSIWTPPRRSAASATSDMLDVTGLLGSLVDKSLVVAEPAGPPCATGCWRRSASSPPNASPRPAERSRRRGHGPLRALPVRCRERRPRT